MQYGNKKSRGYSKRRANNLQKSGLCSTPQSTAPDPPTRGKSNKENIIPDPVGHLSQGKLSFDSLVRPQSYKPRYYNC